METIRDVINGVDWLILVFVAIATSLGMLVTGQTGIWAFFTLVILRIIVGKLMVADLREKCKRLREELARIRAAMGDGDGR